MLHGKKRLKLQNVSDGTITIGDEDKTFDWVFDARGLGAQDRYG